MVFFLGNRNENMNRIVATFQRDENGEIIFKTQISPNYPELVDVTLGEYFEDFINKNLRITIELADASSKELNRNQIQGKLQIKDEKVMLRRSIV